MGFLSSKKKEFTPVRISNKTVARTYNREIMKEESNTYIGKTIRIKGHITSREDMTVEGWIKGDIDINKTLIIERNGKIKADVKANSIRIKGRLKGKIEALDKIEILSEGICDGDIKTDKLVVKEGAYLLGNINIDSENMDELDNEVVKETVIDDEHDIIEGEVIDKDEPKVNQVNDDNKNEEVEVVNNTPEKKTKKKTRKNKKLKKTL